MTLTRAICVFDILWNTVTAAECLAILNLPLPWHPPPSQSRFPSWVNIQCPLETPEQSLYKRLSANHKVQNGIKGSTVANITCDDGMASLEGFELLVRYCWRVKLISTFAAWALALRAETFCFASLVFGVEVFCNHGWFSQYWLASWLCTLWLCRIDCATPLVLAVLLPDGSFDTKYDISLRYELRILSVCLPPWPPV